MALDTGRPEVVFAVDAVRRAGLLARKVQEELVEPALTKDDRSPVTVADFAAQAVVARLLDERFPGEPLVGEENADALRGAPETLGQVASYVGRVVPEATPESVCVWIDHGTAEPVGRSLLLLGVLCSILCRRARPLI